MYRYYLRNFRDIEEILDWLDTMNSGYRLFDVISIMLLNYADCKLLVTYRVLEI